MSKHVRSNPDPGNEPDRSSYLTEAVIMAMVVLLYGAVLIAILAAI